MKNRSIRTPDRAALAALILVATLSSATNAFGANDGDKPVKMCTVQFSVDKLFGMDEDTTENFALQKKAAEEQGLQEAINMTEQLFMKEKSEILVELQERLDANLTRRSYSINPEVARSSSVAIKQMNGGLSNLAMTLKEIQPGGKPNMIKLLVGRFRNKLAQTPITQDVFAKLVGNKTLLEEVDASMKHSIQTLKNNNKQMNEDISEMYEDLKERGIVLERLQSGLQFFEQQLPKLTPEKRKKVEETFIFAIKRKIETMSIIDTQIANTIVEFEAMVVLNNSIILETNENLEVFNALMPLILLRQHNQSEALTAQQSSQLVRAEINAAIRRSNESSKALTEGAAKMGAEPVITMENLEETSRRAEAMVKSNETRIQNITRAIDSRSARVAANRERATISAYEALQNSKGQYELTDKKP